VNGEVCSKDLTEPTLLEISGFGVYVQVADTWTNLLSIPPIHLAELEAVCNIWCDLFDRC
jgi:hypothetical protein